MTSLLARDATVIDAITRRSCCEGLQITLQRNRWYATADWLKEIFQRRAWNAFSSFSQPLRPFFQPDMLRHPMYCIDRKQEEPRSTLGSSSNSTGVASLTTPWPPSA